MSKHFKPIFHNKPTQSRYAISESREGLFLQSHNTTVRVAQNGNLRIQMNDQDVLLTPEDFHPQDPLINVLSGHRVDPAPQSQWTKVLSADWPPPLPETVSIARVQLGSRRSPIPAIQITRDLTQTFGIRLKTWVYVDAQDGGLVLATALENVGHTHPKKLQWAPWHVAPFKVQPGGSPEHPNTIVTFPMAPKEVPQKLKTQESTLWHWNPKTHIMQINPVAYQNRVLDKLVLDKPNWAMVAHRGQNQVLLMRTTMQHPEQFHVYAGMGHYVELETTGPKVGPGNKSLAIMKLESIPLANIGVHGLKQFEPSANLADSAELVAVALHSRLKRGGLKQSI